MEALTDFEIPLYTRYHYEYYKQLAAWYVEMDINKAQIVAHHLDPSKHFEKWKAQWEKISPAFITEEYF